MFWPVPERPPVASFIAVCFNLFAWMLPLPLLQRIAKSIRRNSVIRARIFNHFRAIRPALDKIKLARLAVVRKIVLAYLPHTLRNETFHNKTPCFYPPGGGNIKKNKKPAQTNKNGLSAQAQAQRLRLRH